MIQYLFGALFREKLDSASTYGAGDRFGTILICKIG
jgi:hypothetical protein